MRRLEAKTVFSGLVTAYIYDNKIRNILDKWVCVQAYLSLGWDTDESLAIFGEGNS